ncbi:MAG TPA: dTDP-glucose 4,6-dehydratase [Verrucomicrobiales bacterium]|nr:dTDP-glucose 4,6-dehydratase [Verrucomicrobiales bacterium]
MSQRVLVIGSNSFSGASFVRFLRKQSGLEIVGASRSVEPMPPFRPYAWDQGTEGSKFSFHQFDLCRHLDGLIKQAADMQATHVINFAAQGMVAESWLKPEDWYQTNTVANIMLHDRLRKLPSLRKYVHISTPEVYGSTAGLLKETRSYNPSTPYATSRAACDMSLLNFLENYGFPVVWTRAANVYGPGQQLYRVIPRMIMAILTGKKLQLHGGGHSVRSFIHIDDVASATWEIAQKAEPGSTYHISTDRFISIRDLVQLVCDRMGEDFAKHTEEAPERDGKDAAYLLDAAKVKSEFGWQDRISLEVGIDQTIAWAKEHFEVLRHLPLNYIHKA